MLTFLPFYQQKAIESKQVFLINIAGNIYIYIYILFKKKIFLPVF